MFKLQAFLLAVAFSLTAAFAAGQTSEKGGAKETRYGFILAGNPAGEAVSRIEPDGSRVYTFEFNDRGRGPKTSTRVRLDDHGIPVFVETTGFDYWKSPVMETFERKDGKLIWKNASEDESRAVPADPAFFLSLNGPPQETELLARALLVAPGNRLAVLPTGEGRIEKISSTKVTAPGKGSRTVDLYAVSGLGFTPGFIWLDEQRNLFASLSGWAVLHLDGWQGAMAELTKIQDAAVGKRLKDLAARLARQPKNGVVFTNVRLFDPETKTVRPGTTVVVSGNRIQAVGKDGEVPVPSGADVIDTQGKTMLPGLWDMHTHLGEDDGVLHLAAGVTTVRDLANDTDKLLELKRQWDAGETLGPRVLMAGFMDGPGPYAGPTKVLVDTEEKALAAVDNYAKLGYVQIKLYSSLDPKLVPAIVKRAHEHGLRVSGHIPNGMSAEQAVRAGFDEIQHANFLFLNFLSPDIDTRTPARFSEVAQQAAGLDLKSDKVKAFIALLKEHGTVSDPTLVAFEDMFTAEPGKMSPSLAAVADRFPPQVRRTLFTGGLNPPADKVQLYRDSFRAMGNLVRELHEAGVTIVPGTDALAGFSFHRELELYVAAGLPPADVLRIATLDAAKVMKRDQELGTVAPGKLADLVLIDGDPVAKISDVRHVVLTVKNGVMFDPAALYQTVGVKPVE